MPLGGIEGLYNADSADRCALCWVFCFAISASVNRYEQCDRYGGASGGLTRVCRFLSSPDAKTDVPQQERGVRWAPGSSHAAGVAAGCILRPQRLLNSLRVCGGGR